MRPSTRVLTALVVALVAAGCAPAAGPIAEPTAEPTQHGGAPAPTTSAEPSPPEVPEGLALTGVVERDEPDGVPYARVTLADDHPALTLDPALVAQEVLDAGYDLDDLQEMLRVAARYAVEEGLDSIVVDADRRQEWLEANRHWFDPVIHEDVEEAVATRDDGAVMNGLVDNDAADLRETSGYDLAYPAGAPRITRLVLEVDAVGIAPSGNPAAWFRGYLERPAVPLSDEAVAAYEATGGADGGDPVELLCFTQAYGLVERDGQWLINGWSNEFRYGADSDLCQEVGPRD